MDNKTVNFKGYRKQTNTFKIWMELL